MSHSDPEIRWIQPQESAFRAGVRELGVEDANVVRELRRAAILDCPEALGTPPGVELAKSVHDYERRLRRVRRDPHEFLLGLVRAEGGLCGMMGCGLRQTLGSPHALIYSMYVLPEYRGRGLGRFLLDEAMALAAQRWTFPSYSLTVEAGNQGAIHLYERAGFMVCGRVPRAFRLNAQVYDVLRMQRPLLRAEEGPPPDTCPDGPFHPRR